MAAAQYIERRYAPREEASGREYPGHLAPRRRLGASWKMHDDVHRQHQVEGLIGEWQSSYIALGQPPDAHAAGVFQALPAEVHWEHGELVALLHQARAISGAAASLERTPDVPRGD